MLWRTSSNAAQHFRPLVAFAQAAIHGEFLTPSMACRPWRTRPLGILASPGDALSRFSSTRPLQRIR
jgi:hypothetical protein